MNRTPRNPQCLFTGVITHLNCALGHHLTYCNRKEITTERKGLKFQIGKRNEGTRWCMLKCSICIVFYKFVLIWFIVQQNFAWTTDPLICAKRTQTCTPVESHGFQSGPKIPAIFQWCQMAKPIFQTKSKLSKFYAILEFDAQNWLFNTVEKGKWLPGSACA